MMRAAEEVIVVADSTKFGHQSLAHLCRLEACSTWSSITDHWTSLAQQGFVAAGVEAARGQPERSTDRPTTPRHVFQH